MPSRPERSGWRTRGAPQRGRGELRPIDSQAPRSTARKVLLPGFSEARALLYSQKMRTVFLLVFTLASAHAQSRIVVVRPVEIDDVLVNPGMGIQTFQRFNGDAI